MKSLHIKVAFLAILAFCTPLFARAQSNSTSSATLDTSGKFYSSLNKDQQGLVVFNESIKEIMRNADASNVRWALLIENAISEDDIDISIVKNANTNLEVMVKILALKIPDNLPTSTQLRLEQVKKKIVSGYNQKLTNAIQKYTFLKNNKQNIANSNLDLSEARKTLSEVLQINKLSTDNNGYYILLDDKGKNLDKETNVLIKQQNNLITGASKPVVINKPLKNGCYDDVLSADRYYKNIEHPRFIDTVVIHTSYYAPDNDQNIKKISSDMYSVAGIMQVWEFYEVGPHYLIDRDGIIYKTIDEQNIAWHAGRSLMPDPDKRAEINKFSLGIELLNHETDSLTQKQITSLAWLLKDIGSRHSIKHILGHSDVANGKPDIAFRSEANKLGTIGELIKTDPWGLPWQQINLLIKGRSTQYQP